MGSSLGEVIKRMAVGANDANAPTSVLFGTVTSVKPLVVDTEQKMKLTKEFLILTKNVKDYTIDISLETQRKQITIHNTLKVGDKVILLQQQGGNNFIILDKF